jgi:hypothetical protein
MVCNGLQNVKPDRPRPGRPIRSLLAEGHQLARFHLRQGYGGQVADMEGFIVAFYLRLRQGFGATSRDKSLVITHKFVLLRA